MILQIDFNNAVGIVKPMHAINNMPTVPGDSRKLYHYLTEANIPYTRLHDTGGAYGGSHYVDVDNIFPDFSADENNSDSYDFAFTDALLATINQAGLKPFYRLGSSIENNHRIKAYHIYPPKDFAKWARICEHIIMHYNEGWADGFYYGIEYWEIWCEPDNEPEIADNPMWKGTKEQFFELYEVTALHLKACFPKLKIGGYASCGFYALSEANFSKTANSSSRTEYFVEFFLEFLQYISERQVPMDFFSWHSYAQLSDNVMYAHYAKEKLVEYGYGDAEIIFNEWNPGTHNRGLSGDASNIAAMMCALQHTPVDMSMYYNISINSAYCGVFDPVHFNVYYAYYAFLAYGRLYELGTEVSCTCEVDGCFALAAKNDAGEQAILLVNSNGEAKKMKFESAIEWKGHITCENKMWEEFVCTKDTIELPAYTVLLLER